MLFFDGVDCESGNGEDICGRCVSCWLFRDCVRFCSGVGNGCCFGFGCWGGGCCFLSGGDLWKLCFSLCIVFIVMWCSVW